MLLIFDRAWLLAIAWLPLAWMVFEWRRTARKLGLVLKALSFTAILLALAEPRMILEETKVAVAVLVDTSASSSAADLERASQLAPNHVRGARPPLDARDAVRALHARSDIRRAAE